MGAAGRMADDEVRELLARYDTNGDGQIDYGEFLKVRGRGEKGASIGPLGGCARGWQAVWRGWQGPTPAPPPNPSSPDLVSSIPGPPTPPPLQILHEQDPMLRRASESLKRGALSSVL